MPDCCVNPKVFKKLNGATRVIVLKLQWGNNK